MVYILLVYLFFYPDFCLFITVIPGMGFEEKQFLYDELKCELDMHSADDLVMCFSDINGYIGGFDGVHVGYDVGQRNFEKGMIVVFCLGKELCVSKMWLNRE